VVPTNFDRTEQRGGHLAHRDFMLAKVNAHGASRRQFP
jgi:hypothetical protein